MPAEFHNMEESLKTFLSEGVADSYNKVGRGDSYRYNNLKISMEPGKNKNPHFIVRIGMSEAMFDNVSLEKISGGLGPEEKNVRRWAERHMSRDELNAAWIGATKVIQITTNNGD